METENRLTDEIVTLMDLDTYLAKLTGEVDPEDQCILIYREKAIEMFGINMSTLCFRYKGWLFLPNDSLYDDQLLVAKIEDI